MASPRRDTPSHESSLRASDADRERVVESLREHYGAGRLSEEELSERVEAVYDVRTMSELQALTADLPSPPAPGPRHRRSALEASVRTHLAVYVVVNVMLDRDLGGERRWVLLAGLADPRLGHRRWMSRSTVAGQADSTTRSRRGRAGADAWPAPWPGPGELSRRGGVEHRRRAPEPSARGRT